jgi:hypothetical protein
LAVGDYSRLRTIAVVVVVVEGLVVMEGAVLEGVAEEDQCLREGTVEMLVVEEDVKDQCLHVELMVVVDQDLLKKVFMKRMTRRMLCGGRRQEVRHQQHTTRMMVEKENQDQRERQAQNDLQVPWEGVGGVLACRDEVPSSDFLLCTFEGTCIMHTCHV